MKKVLILVPLVFFYFLIEAEAQIWVTRLTYGQPLSGTYYTGDKISSGGHWYFQFEIGQDSWNSSQVGLGQNVDGTTGWNYENANWYENGSGSNKRVQRDIAEFQFTAAGTWYVVGRAKATLGDAYTYADETGWTNNTQFTTTNASYWSVTALNNPTNQTATSASSSSIDLSWTKWNSKNVMIVRKKSTDSWTEPTQGTAYSVGNTIGSGTVVYNSSGTSYTNTGLAPATGYDYKFYSENYSYYSDGITASATTATTSATDYFRSKATGNWTDASKWESSPDNSTWVTAALVPGVDANTIVIQNGHNITLNGDITVAKLSINSGGIFTSSDDTPRVLTFSKSSSGTSTTLSNSGSWQTGSGTSTIVFTGAPGSGDAIHAISGTIAFQNITVNKTGGSSNVGCSFGTNSLVSGTLEIGQGGFIATAPPASFYGSNAILKFNQGSGATYDVGASDYTWSTSQVPNNISISSGTVNLNSARTASGNLLIDGGTLSLAAMLTIQGNWTRSSGTFTPNSQTVNLSGTTNTLITTATEAVLYDLVVSKTGGAYVTLGSNLSVTHSMSISNGAIFKVPSSKALTVSGTLTNSATATGLVVESGGSLIQSSASVEATVEREINAWSDATHGWHYLSAPVAAQAISSGFTASPATNYDFYAWWEPTNQWVNYKNTTLAPVWNTANVLVPGGTSGEDYFIPGKGYLVAYAASSTKQFSGTLNKDNITISNLPITGTSANGGWHLLGNPFSSALTWGTADWSLSHINATAKIWKESTASWIDVTSGSGIIPALNGFMVQVTATYGGNNAITIPAAARLHDATSWYKSSSDPLIKLIANDPAGKTAQESVIRFIPDATGSFDPAYDCHFMAGYAPQFYSVAGDEHLSTNALPASGGVVQIPFDFIPNNGTDFTLEAGTISGIYGPVILTDLKTGNTQDLTTNPVYAFSSAAGDPAARFLLGFGQVGISEPSAGEPITIKGFGKTITVSDASGSATGQIQVFNMLGQVVLEQPLSGGLTTRCTMTGPTGYYLVQVVTGNHTSTGKVFIQ